MSCISCSCSPCSCNPLVALSTCAPQISCVPSVCVPCDPCPPACNLAAAKVTEELSGFVLPAVDVGISVAILDVCSWVVGCCVFVKDGVEEAFLRIDAIDADNKTIFLVNIGAEVNPTPGYVFINPTTIILHGPCPEGSSGELECKELKVDVEEAFVVPLEGSSVNITFAECLDIADGQSVFIEGAGIFSGVTISNDPLAILRLSARCLLDGVTPGVTSIPAGNYMVTAETCITTDPLGAISGTGISTDPIVLGSIHSFVVHSAGDAVGGTEQDVEVFQGAFDIPPNDISSTGNVGDPLIYANTKFDVGSNFNVGRDGYVVPIDGEYLFYVSVQIEGAGDGAATLLPADSYGAGIYRFAAGGAVFSLPTFGYGESIRLQGAIEDLAVGAFAKEVLVAGDVIKTGLTSVALQDLSAENRVFGGHLVRRT